MQILVIDVVHGYLACRYEVLKVEIRMQNYLQKTQESQHFTYGRGGESSCT